MNIDQSIKLLPREYVPVISSKSLTNFLRRAEQVFTERDYEQLGLTSHELPVPTEQELQYLDKINQTKQPFERARDSAYNFWRRVQVQVEIAETRQEAREYNYA